MKILVIGSGGREHALAWKLAQTEQVFAIPGNPGIAAIAQCFPQADPVEFSKSEGIDLVVIGPEVPLIDGLADRLREAGIPVFGPGQAGAKLEGSKAFCKAMMAQADVPTARFGSFTDPAKAKAFAATLPLAVVKASGNAQGKGVIVCDSLAEAEKAIDEILTDHIFGSAGNEIVVEERLQGPEFSLLTLVSGTHYRSLPVAQDYKRAHDADQGPNTGGMGSVCPADWVTQELIDQTEREIVAPILQALAEENIDYRGVLFSGLLVQNGQPYCLEYNVRFGDPETQSVLPRLGPEFVEALLACAKGEPIPEISISNQAAVTIVVAAEGYPESPRKGDLIQLPQNPDGLIFHAGTTEKDGQLITNGGRVFGATALGSTPAAARAKAYATAETIEFKGAWFRKDIALHK